jgi:ADP-ribose pyrophosphatase YjhB (NUDIX family)
MDSSTAGSHSRATGLKAPLATTPLVAELLIIGLETEACIALVTLSIFGTDWISLEDVKSWVLPITILALALAYVLGILVDRLADWIFKRFLPQQASKTRMKVFDKSPGMAAFLEYQRSRERIARGTAVNAVIAVFSGVAFLIAQTHARWPAILGYVLVMLAAVLASHLATASIHRGWLKRMRDADRLVNDDPDPTTMHGPELVAAICYRWRRDKLRFLLVRSSGGNRWTLPTGHVKGGEDALAAAERQAYEMAAVHDGRVLREELTQYAHSRATSPGLITAYLYAVADDDDPEKDGRRPKWVGARRAKRALSKGRRRKYAEEHRRVVDEAVAELNRLKESEGGRPRA